MTRDPANERQVTASDPHASTWLSANAGSGKTRVLTDRVARLLLQDVEPQRILCLTYTKSAASEMQNRLFKTLGEWAMKPDETLRAALLELGDEHRDSQHLARARRLFARAIEAPGGLRIQTIHSFCATLLRRFPLEAGVSPRFGELDERTGRLLRQEILEEMASGLSPHVVAEVAMQFSGSDFMALIEQIVSKRDSFRTNRPDSDLFWTGRLEAEDVIAHVFLGGEAVWIEQVLSVLATGTAKDLKAHGQLAVLEFQNPDLDTLEGLEDALLFTAKAATPFGAKIGTFPTKPIQSKLGDTLPKLEQLMRRVEAARAQRIAVKAARKTEALRDFAAVFLPLYEDRKARHGWLDFDDLIARATALVTDPSVAAWVLYRLDGGIDHVLVDEAQDTSPAQWRVIELLTAEFTAGNSAHDGARTLFVVGDQKQSIYSFQGADVAAFENKHAAFRQRFQAVDLPFQSLKLEHSFRSAPAILTFVDCALRDRDEAALGPDISHIAFRESLPGRVDLWPLIEGEKEPVDKNFEDPVDLISATHHLARLAEGIAVEIKRMLDSGVSISTKGGVRAVHAGDFLILVQRRSALFTEIIRACKQRALPIAGADRLKLGAELAVKDLLGLLSFLDTPDDNLSLAAVLRSPLCGSTEAELFGLANGRAGSLWSSLQDKAGQFPDAFALLSDLRDQVDFLRPFDLLERALIRHNGRTRLIARLGDEAEDGIDELLNQSLAYERADVPSLTGFLIWLDAEQIDIKRQAEASGHRIRVMTVHGAKGLESEIVILPDTADHKSQDRDEIYLTDDGKPIWKTSAAESPPLTSALRERKKTREAEENLRLLYVAMTRARTWLIICGAGSAVSDASWYAIAQEGMDLVGGQSFDLGRRFETGVWPVPFGASYVGVYVPQEPATWAISAPSALQPAQRVLSPSGLGGAKALPGEPNVVEGTTATARGVAIHLLLQHLPDYPSADWAYLAQHLIADPLLRNSAFAEAQRVLAKTDHTHLFGPDSLAEVAVTAEFAGQRIYGVIDRLIVGAGHVLAVDFKSNTVVPDSSYAIPDGLLRQLAAYQHILSQIYPNHRIKMAILWTRPALLMPVDADIVRRALIAATIDSFHDP